MVNSILLYLGAFLTFMWGVAHLFPTRNVVRDFGNISEDNRNIITMEWIVEGVSLIFLGILTAVTTFIDPNGSSTKVIMFVIAAELITLAIVSLFTGFKVKFLPFKLCPVILLVSAGLILTGAII
jgi:hypothetical protein